ncbi:hypothetical protein ACFSR6_00690 [Pedobacter vanadiisoli]|uniref:Uncharacterized protein n=1 Tax=Pedobacter vanadiisoli TaxID=1761975 RepID=A0ABW5MFG0_9SPHI
MSREKWGKERILEVCQKLYEEWKIIPTKTLMIKRGYQKLARYAIPKYFKNFRNLHEALLLPNSRKSPEYWNLKNTVIELREFCQANRKLIEDTSITKAIYRIKNFGLMNAAQKHGGLKALNRRFKLGITFKSKKWTKSKVIHDLKEFHQSGQVINRKNLSSLGKNGLLWAISKFGNLTTFKRAIGIQAKKLQRWDDSSIIKNLKQLIVKHGFFPNTSVLKMLGRYDLLRAISNNGGFSKFTKLLNAPSRTFFPAKDGHYLQSSYECIFDNILFKYDIPHLVHVRISEEHLYKCDFLIGNTYIEIAGYRRSNSNSYEVKMARKIQIYKELKKEYIIIPQKVFCQRIEYIEKKVLCIINKIDLQPAKPLVPQRDSCLKPPTFWADFKNIENELKPFILKYDRMPTIKELYNAGKAMVVHAIYRYHGTTYDVAQLLKVKSKQVSQQYYTRNKTIHDYKQLCIAHNKYLTIKQLYSLNLRSLAHAINKHCGFQGIRQECKLGFSIRQVRQPVFSYEDIILEYKNLCKQYRRFLTRRELTDYGFSSLAGYLNRHGLSLRLARKKSGLSFITPYLPWNYYTLTEVVEAYKEQCQIHGHFLTRREALTVLSPKMIGHIDRYISYTKLKEMTELKF